MRSKVALALLMPVALGACAVIPRGYAPEPPVVPMLGPELVGQTLRVETRGGQVSALRFGGQGAVTAQFGNSTLDGRWSTEPGRLCFLWGQAPRECWPYETPFRRGETISLISDRGNAVRVTLI